MSVAEAASARNDVTIAEVQKNARETVIITTGSYNGHSFVGMRVWVPGRDGDLIPTQKGFNIAPDKVPAIIEALTAALAG